MAEPLKNLFNEEVLNCFSSAIEKNQPGFPKKDFLKAVFNEDWENLELKQRARHISLVLHRFLNDDYEKDLKVLASAIDLIDQTGKNDFGITAMCFPDYIEVFGQEDPDLSLKAMERFTQFFSCEFAIRPFILKYPEKTLKIMTSWSKHAHPQVRRLSTEGCRPRLPWAMAIPFLKKDPSPILSILENLKDDPAETVRKSVANNLNDISKDNPEMALKLVKKWKGKSKNTDWVVKHGSRTLLKQAHPEALSCFGYGSADSIKVSDFHVLVPRVKLGEDLFFAFELQNTSTKDLLVRLEYAVYYLKANGSHSKKVFKISEKEYMAGEKSSIKRKQSFRPISTRKHYQGEHKVSLIVNGKESAIHLFHLLD